MFWAIVLFSYSSEEKVSWPPWMPSSPAPAASSCALKLFKARLLLKCMNLYIALNVLVFDLSPLMVLHHQKFSKLLHEQWSGPWAHWKMWSWKHKIESLYTEPPVLHLFKHIHYTSEWLLLLFSKLYMIPLLMF